MLTPKENLLETLKHGDGHPECLLNSYTMLRGIAGGPCFKLIRGNRIRGTNSYDAWGTYIMFPETQPAAVPMVTPENAVIKDIEHWRESVHVPDLVGKCSDGWEEAIANKETIDPRYATMVVMGTGIFEQMHMLMTFEDTLTSFLEAPEETHELIDVICDYRMTYMRLVVEHLHPDLIVSHDDWGTSDRMFMSPDTWREFFKEPYRRLYDYLHSQGVIVMHHADSYLEPIVEDMAQIGVDIWQGVLPSNDIEKIAGQVGDRMLLMGELGCGPRGRYRGRDKGRDAQGARRVRRAPGLLARHDLRRPRHRVPGCRAHHHRRDQPIQPGEVRCRDLRLMPDACGMSRSLVGLRLAIYD